MKFQWLKRKHLFQKRKAARILVIFGIKSLAESMHATVKEKNNNKAKPRIMES